MRTFLVLGVAAFLGLAACSRSSSSGPTSSTNGASSSYVVASASAPAAAAASAPVASASDAGSAGDAYVGAIGGHAVHATLVALPTSIEGRWFYESHRAAGGLGVSCKSKSENGPCDGSELGDKDAVTGKIHLERVGPSLVGSWEKPTGNDQLGVRLTPVVRSRGADHVITARRLLPKRPKGSQDAGVFFAPAVEGAAAARLAPSITVKALFGMSENDLIAADGADNVTTTSLDFDVLRDDDAILTLSWTIETMGAYPDSSTQFGSFAWATGKRVNASAISTDKKAGLVKLLNGRVHAAWRAKKAEYAKAPPNADCGKDVAESFMDGDGPSFTAQQLDGIYATKSGIAFDFGFDFAHAVRACQPEVDLSMTAAEAKPFLDPKGPLGAL